MSEESYAYLIVGGGLAGASAVEGIRERDPGGSILLMGRESRRPYDRPPLTKKLWFGGKTVEEIYLHDRRFYERNGVRVVLGREAAAVDGRRRTVTDRAGRPYRYEKLLLATGGAPRRLPIPGGDLEGIYYYRTLDDYLRLRAEVSEGVAVTVIGGGFIGSEIAAALRQNGAEVTMVFPGAHLCARVFPASLAEAVTRDYGQRGIRILAGEKPASISRAGRRLSIRTESGRRIESDLIVVGVGIAPEVELAEAAGAEVEDGIVVNELLQTSLPGVYAAGDNALFPYRALGRRTRVEHWDNALTQGKQAGRNMAGAQEAYTHLPYFFSDLFELGYEAVGECDPRLETFADWQRENHTGVIYYLKEGRVRGVLMVNVWNRVEAARELIRRGEAVGAGAAAADLRGAIR